MKIIWLNGGKWYLSWTASISQAYWPNICVACHETQEITFGNNKRNIYRYFQLKSGKTQNDKGCVIKRIKRTIAQWVTWHGYPYYTYNKLERDFQISKHHLISQGEN